MVRIRLQTIFSAIYVIVVFSKAMSYLVITTLIVNARAVARAIYCKRVTKSYLR